jgi:uncharacterized membrane protein
MFSLRAILFLQRRRISMKHDHLTKIVLSALFASLTCIATLLIQIPMPATNGYINLGDGVVLLGAFLLGPVYGFAAGGLGSMLADLLLGYAVYAPGTFIIKGATALVAALLLRAMHGKLSGLLAGGVLGELVMVLGYFAYEGLALGYGLAAAASIPGNALQGVAGIAVGVLAYKTLHSVPAIKRLSYL